MKKNLRPFVILVVLSIVAPCAAEDKDSIRNDHIGYRVKGRDYIITPSGQVLQAVPKIYEGAPVMGQRRDGKDYEKEPSNDESPDSKIPEPNPSSEDYDKSVGEKDKTW